MSFFNELCMLLPKYNVSVQHSDQIPIVTQRIAVLRYGVIILKCLCYLGVALPYRCRDNALHCFTCKNLPSSPDCLRVNIHNDPVVSQTYDPKIES